MRRFNSLIMVLGSLFYFSSCAVSYRPMQKGLGYTVLKSSSNTYRIEYGDFEPKIALSFAQKTAKNICAGDYKVLYGHNTAVNTGAYTVLMAGQYQDFKRIVQIYEAEIECMALRPEPPLDLVISSSPWFYYTESGRKVPVSGEYLSNRFGVGTWIIEKIQTYHSGTPLEILLKDLGQPQKILTVRDVVEWQWAKTDSLLIVRHRNKVITEIAIQSFAYESMLQLALLNQFTPTAEAVLPDNYPRYYRLTLE